MGSSDLMKWGVLALSLAALIGGTYQTGYRTAAMKKNAEIAVIRAEQVAGLLAAEQAHNAKLEQAEAEWRQRLESAERQARGLAAAKNELIRQSETLRGRIHATVKQDEALGGCINGLGPDSLRLYNQALGYAD